MAKSEAVSLQDVLARLDGVRQRGDNYSAKCPAHEDNRASLSVTEDDRGVTFKCFAGCEYKAIARALGFEPSQLFRQDHSEASIHVNGKKPRLGKIVATYDYLDAEGELKYQVVRYEPKDFRQRRPDGKGGWLWNLDGVQRVLYRLQKVQQAVKASHTVFLVEGEKDVHALENWKAVATTNASGANKWDASYERALIGAKLVLIPDNDEAGLQHMRRVARALHGKAESIRILELPGLPEKGDFSDWIAAGGTPDEFRELLRKTPFWTPEESGALPEIEVTDRPLRSVSRDAMYALELSNVPPRLFVRVGSLVRVKRDEKGRAIVEPVGLPHVRGYLTRAADFVSITKNGPRHENPPDAVVADVLAMGDWPMPALSGITEMPVFRPDGTIVSQPGYDAATGMFYAPAGNLAFPPIPDTPTTQDVSAALSLLDEVFGELPYVDQPSRANSWASVLTPILRPVIKGRVPLALINAPQAGTGKSTFAELVCILGTGREGALMTAPVKEEEWSKKLTATFMEGAAIIVIDNVEGLLVSPALAAALTMAVWKDRVLGFSRTVEVPIECTWIATGNNVELGGDLPRRCYPINLDARVAQPWKRTGYKHPHPQTWALANRGRLVAAALTVARYWFASGCPAANVPSMGGYEEWSRILGCVLAAAGIEGFLANLEEMYSQTNPTSGQWEGFLEAWRAVYGKNGKRVAEVVADLRSTMSQFGSMTEIDTAMIALREAIPDDLNIEIEGSVDATKKRLGKALSRKVGVRHGEDQLHVRRMAPDSDAKVERWAVWNATEGC